MIIFRLSGYRADIHKGLYRCKATNRHGSIVSRQTTVEAGRQIRVQTDKTSLDKFRICGFRFPETFPHFLISNLSKPVYFYTTFLLSRNFFVKVNIQVLRKLVHSQ